MHSGLEELYQSIILDHNRRPRNFGMPAGTAQRASGRNPLCGDELDLWLRLDGDTIAEIGFTGTGCAISRAAASLMTTAVRGRTRDEAEEMFGRFHDVVTGRTPAGETAALERPLAVFSGVSRFPVRVKCASLPWHTLRAALRAPESAPPTVSTE